MGCRCCDARSCSISPWPWVRACLAWRRHVSEGALQGASLIVSCRSWLDCRLRLVVRYVDARPATPAQLFAGRCPAGPMLTFQGYHVPAVRHRDAFYQKIEDERASALGQK